MFCQEQHDFFIASEGELLKLIEDNLIPLSKCTTMKSMCLVLKIRNPRNNVFCLTEAVLRRLLEVCDHGSPMFAYYLYLLGNFTVADHARIQHDCAYCAGNGNCFCARVVMELYKEGMSGLPVFRYPGLADGSSKELFSRTGNDLYVLDHNAVSSLHVAMLRLNSHQCR